MTLNVNPVNAPPVANPDAYSVSENTQFSISGPGILANDFSPNNPPSLPLNAQLVANVSHGVLNLAPDGSITYTPGPNFVGTDSFTYNDIDANGLISATTTVTFNVSTATTLPPIAIAPSLTFTTSQNKPLFVAAPGVLTNNSDPNGDTLTAFVVDSTAHGTLTLSGDGSFNYTPDPNFNGADSFTYKATNGTFTSPLTTVNLIVNQSPDQPVANPDNYVASENTPLTIPSADGVVRGVLANDFDLDGDTLTAVLINGPLFAAPGSFVLNPDGSFRYTPAPNFHGSDTFTYQAVDQTVTPNLKSAITTVTIDVAQVFTTPTANPDNFSATQGFPLSVAAPGVLANDTDPNGFLLSAVLVDAPAHGSLTLNGDGSFVYVAAPNYGGPDAFTYEASDGKGVSGVATVSLVVHAAPTSQPIVADNTFSTNEGSPLFVGAPGVLLGSVDFSTTPLAAVTKTEPLHGSLELNTNGAFVYAPNPGFSGVDSFTFQASDGKLASNVGTITINVLRVVLPPVEQNLAFTTQEDQRLVVFAPGVLAGATDPQGLPLTASVASFPQSGSLLLNSAGGFVYTPNPGLEAIDSFTFRASDGMAVAAPATMTIAVTPIAGTTVHVVPSSITGVSTTSTVTRITTPSFAGTTIPFAPVFLYAIPTATPAGLLMGSPPNAGPGVVARAAAAGLAVVGETTSDANGNYIVTSIPLLDGSYNFFVEALRPDGLSTGAVYAGALTIDTVAPTILNVQLLARAGEIAVTFQDNLSGMDPISLANAMNYSFSRQFFVNPKLDVITSAQVLPTANSTDPVTVILHTSSPRIRSGRYLFQVIAGGIRDVAGNPLAGAFTGTYPTGNGAGGTNFNATFYTNGANVVPAKPTTQPIPVVTTQAPARGAKPRVYLAQIVALNSPSGALAQSFARRRR